MLAAILIAASCGQSAGPTDASTVDHATPDVLALNAEDGSTTCFPPCLEALLASCPTGMTCVHQTLSSMFPEHDRVCFPNGTTEDQISQDGGHHRVVVNGESGSLCFAFEGETQIAPYLHTFSDADGRLVAMFSTPSGDPAAVVISCGGVDYPVNVHAPICNGRFLGYTGPCTEATCP